jgi:hypothetical protein
MNYQKSQKIEKPFDFPFSQIDPSLKVDERVFNMEWASRAF